MALRLDEYIVGGEIFNTTHYSVHGWIELRGREQPLVLQLTGNCSPDLAGWHFRFEARPAIGDAPSDEASEDLDLLAIQQIGPTGTMTAVRRPHPTGPLPADPAVKSPAQPAGTGEPGRYLYLEWHSQNGCVLIELVDPLIEFVEYQPLQAGPLADGTSSVPQETPGLPGVESTQVSTPPTDQDDHSSPDAGVPFDDESGDDQDDDPYNLFPHDLQLQLDLEAVQPDWDADDEDEKPQMLREMELMDELIENSPGVPVSDLFDGPLKCPLPDQLADHEVEAALKTLLAQMALHGVALDVCEHFSPREAYQLLLEKICPEERAYPELRHTQWVQHYSTGDYCPFCQAERQEEHGEDDGDPDDNIEF